MATPTARNPAIGARVQSSAKSTVFRCNFPRCHQTFPTKSQLKKHKDSDPNHDYCRKCDQNFDDWDSYVQHRYADPAHQDDKIKVCPICGAEFQSHGGRAKHITQQHPVQHDITCFGCGKRFRQPSAYIGHIENESCPNLKKSQLQSRIHHKTTIKKLLDKEGAGSSLGSAAGHAAIRAGYGVGGSTVGLPERVADIADMPIPEQAHVQSHWRRQEGGEQARSRHDLLLDDEDKYPALEPGVPTEPKGKQKARQADTAKDSVRNGLSGNPWHIQSAANQGTAGSNAAAGVDIDAVTDQMEQTELGGGWSDYGDASIWPHQSMHPKSGNYTTDNCFEADQGRPFNPDRLNTDFTMVHEWARQVETSAPPPPADVISDDEPDAPVESLTEGWTGTPSTPQARAGGRPGSSESMGDDSPPGGVQLSQPEGHVLDPERQQEEYRKSSKAGRADRRDGSVVAGSGLGLGAHPSGRTASSAFAPSSRIPQMGDLIHPSEDNNLFRLHFWDPAHPNFNVDRLFNRKDRRYHCPHPDCNFSTLYASPGTAGEEALPSSSGRGEVAYGADGKVINTRPSPAGPATNIVAHLLQDHINRISTRCPECRRTFGSLQALVAHVTSLSSKCKIRKRETYTEKLAVMTGGFVSAVESRRGYLEGRNGGDGDDDDDDEGLDGVQGGRGGFSRLGGKSLDMKMQHGDGRAGNPSGKGKVTGQVEEKVVFGLGGRVVPGAAPAAKHKRSRKKKPNKSADGGAVVDDDGAEKENNDENPSTTGMGTKADGHGSGAAPRTGSTSTPDLRFKPSTSASASAAAMANRAAAAAAAAAAGLGDCGTGSGIGSGRGDTTTAGGFPSSVATSATRARTRETVLKFQAGEPVELEHELRAGRKVVTSGRVH